MPILSPLSMVSPLNVHANALTSKHDLTSQFYANTLTSACSHLLMLVPNALTSKHNLTSQFSCQMLSPPSMTSSLSFHANTLTSKHDLTSQLSC